VPLVVDASVTLAWLLEDESDPIADEAFDRVGPEQAFAPTIWWYEVRNILIVNERRERLTAARSDVFLNDLAGLPIEIDTERRAEPIFTLARRHRLSFYDAAYLELALRRRVPLATIDRALAAAARTEHIPLVGDKT
jgi:predicted nucleic acid-binding protein